jgi:hypothetical protein
MNKKNINQFFLSLVGDYYKPYPGLFRPSNQPMGIDLYSDYGYVSYYKEEVGRQTELERMNL